MKNIRIDSRLKELYPKAVLACVQCRVQVKESPKELLNELKKTEDRIQETCPTNSEIAKREPIAHTREAYKAFGKEPGRYRGSSEAMHRRIRQGKGLYYINNVVDCNNLVSLKTGYSMGVYDTAQIGEEIVWKVAEPGSCYRGIGKEEINVEFLPVLEDEQGPFGNPTSDSTRAMIREETKEVLMCIYGLGALSLETELEEMKRVLRIYCGSESFEEALIL